MKFLIKLFLLLPILINLTGNQAEAVGKRESKRPKTALSVEFRTSKGDFDSIRKQRMLRVAVPYSRTLFFNDRGIQRGLTAEGLRDFERWLNKKYKTGAHPITIYALPTTRDRLLNKVVEGKADIAAGNLTITAKRDRAVDFSEPILQDIAEIVVTGPAAPELASLDDLAGKEIHVRRSSSYHDSLNRLNEDFRQRGMPEITLTEVSDALEDEDLMDMVNAGIIGIIVVDDWKVRLWARILKNLQLHENIQIAEEGNSGWAFRENNPLLAAEINQFIAETGHAEKYSRRLATYQRRIRALKNPTTEADWQRFETTIDLFKTYGERYSFDYLMVAAQGFQESGLNQEARSPAGAVGIMQLLPSTGKELSVGDIYLAEPNVHGGIKYMRYLIERHFSHADFDETNRTLFAFAAYNAGAARVARLRREAEKAGMNPNQWFNNVELIAAKRIGQETVGYVRNIYKYYTAYKLQLATLEARRTALRKALQEAQQQSEDMKDIVR